LLILLCSRCQLALMWPCQPVFDMAESACVCYGNVSLCLIWPGQPVFDMAGSACV
jgi:hypothetical protein